VTFNDKLQLYDVTMLDVCNNVEPQRTLCYGKPKPAKARTIVRGGSKVGGKNNTSDKASRLRKDANFS
jgi:hypothetical protein